MAVLNETREGLEAKLRELDQKELGAEAARLVARLHEIRAAAAKLVVAVNDQPNLDLAAACKTAANLAEEAGQHGVRLSELRNA